ncbi:hypothetical protein AMECASPLE_002856 [Ameca splendens]|uniref:Uncharacterized protein n=1 Tax=Ameca splendens TaxID=208324 RepID=A0ABV0ZK85_9TELE
MLQMLVTVSRSPAEGECSKWAPSYIASCDVRLGAPRHISRNVRRNLYERTVLDTKWPKTPGGLVASSNVQMVQYSANKWSNICDKPNSNLIPPLKRPVSFSLLLFTQTDTIIPQ